jgi:hypothetical protein
MNRCALATTGSQIYGQYLTGHDLIWTIRSAQRLGSNHRKHLFSAVALGSNGTRPSSPIDRTDSGVHTHTAAPETLLSPPHRRTQIQHHGVQPRFELAQHQEEEMKNTKDGSLPVLAQQSWLPTGMRIRGGSPILVWDSRRRFHLRRPSTKPPCTVKSRDAQAPPIAARRVFLRVCQRWWPVAGFDDDEETPTLRRRSTLAEDTRTRGGIPRRARDTRRGRGVAHRRDPCWLPAHWSAVAHTVPASATKRPGGTGEGVTAAPWFYSLAMESDFTDFGQQQTLRRGSLRGIRAFVALLPWTPHGVYAWCGGGEVPGAICRDEVPPRCA